MKNEIPVIKGEKVYLRPTEADDLAKFAEWEVQPHVTSFFTMNDGRTLEEIRGEVEGRADDPASVDFTVCSLEDDRI
ncbi:MAG: hypothetical protein II018_03475, partial [Firmicutes bacterium]|nr:hypothetical protein [Bacillota bacterium]